MLPWSLMPLLAAEPRVDAGGGVDVVAGALLPGTTVVGVRQVEGDVQVSGDAVRARLDLDAGLMVEDGRLLWYFVRPEHASVTVSAGKAWLTAGIAPAPWRIERVDGWDNLLVTESSGTLAAPGSVLGATLGFGRETQGVSIVGGFDAGPGLDLAQPVAAQLTTGLVGVYGRTGDDRAMVGGGLFLYPGAAYAAGAEVGGRATIGIVSLQGEIFAGWRRPSSISAEVGLLPAGLITPAARVEWAEGATGGGLGVRIKPTPFAVFKVEAAYLRGVPQGWIEAAVFTPWPPGAPRKRR